MRRRIAGERYVPGITRGTLADLAAVPICAFVGYNGMGKSLAAVAAAMTHLDAGRPVLSTVRLLDYAHPRPCDDDACISPSHGMDGHRAAHPLWQPLHDFRQLFTFTNGHVLMDEVTGVADAREHASMPVQVANWLPQLRRRGVTLAWTTINWKFADTRLRHVTRAACWAVGLMPTYAPGEMWPRNRLFYYRTFDAQGLADDFDPAKRDGLPVLNRSVLYRPSSRVQDAYDTADAVLSLGAANEAGMCLTCGGKRAMPRCSCSTAAPGPVDLPAPAGPGRSRRAPRPERSEDVGAGSGADPGEARLVPAPRARRLRVGSAQTAIRAPRAGRPDHPASAFLGAPDGSDDSSAAQ